METNGRPDGMSDLEWLVALEEIRQLKARRDRYVDSRDYDALEALHAPDHVSFNDGYEPWTSSKELIESLRLIGRDAGDDFVAVHHSYDPDIVFDSPTKARGIWAMNAAGLDRRDGSEKWSHAFGWYYETYEKRDGRWLFTTRRWHRYFTFGSEGVDFPTDPPKTSDVFDEEPFGAPSSPHAPDNAS